MGGNRREMRGPRRRIVGFLGKEAKAAGASGRSFGSHEREYEEGSLNMATGNGFATSKAKFSRQ